MAPELAAQKVASLEPGSVVLDPMMGSGTFPLAASGSGHRAFGCDTDPLALIISNTAAGMFDLEDLVTHARDVVSRASREEEANLPVDAETLAFIDFWFDPVAKNRLAVLADEIRKRPTSLHAPLWCAFSRLIITKDAGASRARDVSHSRPHRVREAATIDPLTAFLPAVQTIARRVAASRISNVDVIPHTSSTPSLIRADARALPLSDDCIDSVMTSPPYLVAIDYLRGHRMSLVWMGHSLSDLRSLRSSNVGSSAGSRPSKEVSALIGDVTSGELSRQAANVVARYIGDLDAVIGEIARVLKPGGSAAFVVANAVMGGVPVSIEKILTRVASDHSCALVDRVSRALPADSRYLPPPKDGPGSLAKRMKEEIVLSFTAG
ncbi:hypothetical protein [Catenulispora sp. GAS73]|uniref:hypothetical protein n=1 Tax=Catenulispora sp. GAS73 TaxID=3156269 RepID=UPI0035165C73